MIYWCIRIKRHAKSSANQVHNATHTKEQKLTEANKDAKRASRPHLASLALLSVAGWAASRVSAARWLYWLQNRQSHLSRSDSLAGARSCILLKSYALASTLFTQRPYNDAYNDRIIAIIICNVSSAPLSYMAELWNGWWKAPYAKDNAGMQDWLMTFGTLTKQHKTFSFLR